MRKMSAATMALAAFLASSFLAVLSGQEPTADPSTRPAGPPTANVPADAGDAAVATVGEHPLAPALAMARAGLAGIQATIRDYSCTMVKRERVDGKLGETQYIFVKIRHQPFSEIGRAHV